MNKISHTIFKCMPVLLITFVTACGGSFDKSPDQRETKLHALPPTDTLTFSGKRNDYIIRKTSSGFEIASTNNTGDVTVVASSISRLIFSDISVNLTVSEKSKTITTAQLNNLVELYIAFFNRIPDADGMSYWIDQVRNGMSTEILANNFYDAAIQFSDVTGYSASMSDKDFVKIIYRNVLGRSGTTAPPDADVNYWANALASGSSTKATLVRTMLNAARSFAGDTTYGWVPALLDNKVGVGKYFAVEQGLVYNSGQLNINNGVAIAATITPSDMNAAISKIGINDNSFNQIQPEAVNGRIAMIIGSVGGNGNLDGNGIAARFNAPQGIAIGSSGELYIADTDNNMIRKITITGQVITVAGNGTKGLVDGEGSTAQFNAPTSLVVDKSGNIFVTDQLNHVIRKINPEGIVSTYAGNTQQLTQWSGCKLIDGNQLTANFCHPNGIKLNSAGELIIADTGNNAIRKIGTDGRVTTQVLLYGFGNLSAKFALDSNDNVYVHYEHPYNNIDVFGIDGRLKRRIENLGYSDQNSRGLAIDAQGNLIGLNSQAVFKLSLENKLQVAAGNYDKGKGFADGNPVNALFNDPRDLVADKAGNLYIVDTSNNVIRKIDQNGEVSTIAGAASINGAIKNPDPISFYPPIRGMVMRKNGDIFVTQSTFDSLAIINDHSIHKITPDGTKSTYAGKVNLTQNKDGSVTEALFFTPTSLYVDAIDNLYVSEEKKGGCGRQFRKIDVADKVSTIGSAECDFSTPIGAVFDSSGGVLLSSLRMNAIYQSNSIGQKQIYAGNQDNADYIDGATLGARFNGPAGLARDKNSNLYVADRFNHVIRKITQNGIVTTLAGKAGSAGFNEGKESARFNMPNQMTIDSAGNLYVSDQTCNCVIRKITPSGLVTTLAGNPRKWGLVLAALPGSLPSIAAMSVDKNDTLVIATSNALLRINTKN